MNAIKLKILNLLREINELEKNIMIISIYEQENEKIKENTNLITKKKEEIVNLEKQLNEKIEKEKEKEKEKYKKENMIKQNEAEKNKMKNMDDTMGEMKVNTYDININNNNNIMNDIRAKNIEKNKKEMKLNEEKKRLKKEKLIGVNI
jgi:hypothetical protein